MTPADALEAEMLGDYEGAADVWRALAAEHMHAAVAVFEDPAAMPLGWGVDLRAKATIYQWHAERCDWEAKHHCARLLACNGASR